MSVSQSSHSISMLPLSSLITVQVCFFGLLGNDMEWVLSQSLEDKVLWGKLSLLRGGVQSWWQPTRAEDGGVNTFSPPSLRHFESDAVWWSQRANYQLVIFCLTFGFGPFWDDFWPLIGNAMPFSGQHSFDCTGLTGSRRPWSTCPPVQQSTQSSERVTNSSRFGWMVGWLDGWPELMKDRMLLIIEMCNLLKWNIVWWNMKLVSWK